MSPPVARLDRSAVGNRATARVLSRAYESERYEAPLDDAPFELVFTGRNLLMEGTGWMQSWSAVSGEAIGVVGDPQYGGQTFGGSIGHLEFDYSVAAQQEKNKGPIPEGKYWIDPTELHDTTKWHGLPNPAYLLWESRGWGKHRVTIHPHISTKTYGRGGFFIHGGTDPGSIGCIDLWDHMESFVPVLEEEARRAKAAIATGSATQATKIELTVDYSQFRSARYVLPAAGANKY
jgi:Protein of unknown function (DUF2778)